MAKRLYRNILAHNHVWKCYPACLWLFYRFLVIPGLYCTERHQFRAFIGDWYVGHLSTVFTSLLSLILFIAMGAISTTNSVYAAGSDTSIYGMLSSTMDIGSQLMISSFGSAISFTLLIDYIAISIPSIIYIKKRRDLFQYSYKKLRSRIAKMYDDE